MTAELLLYALIAAGLVFWLRSILGTRHGEERDRPNPFTGVPPDKAPVKQAGERTDGLLTLAEEPAAAAPLPANFTISEGAQPAVQDITKADQTFELGHFAQGAGDAFAYVVESFADGDRDTLKDLLAPGVFTAFDGALKEREERGETAQTDIHAVRRVELLEARLKDKMIYLTVRFVTEETNVMRDKSDAIISGDPDRTVEMVNIWTFGRTVRAKDPRWLVYQTDGGEEPQAHA